MEEQSEPYVPALPTFFDRIVSSLVFHRLTTVKKRRTVAKVRERLRSGGEQHVVETHRR